MENLLISIIENKKFSAYFMVFMVSMVIMVSMVCMVSMVNTTY